MYSRTNPFISQVIDRYNLCKIGSQKETHHVVLDLKGSDLTYAVGDSIGIYPVNEPRIIDLTLQAMHAKGDEIVQDRDGNPWQLHTFLEKKANLAAVTKKLLTPIPALHELLADQQKLASFCETREVWDTLLEHPEVRFTPQELCSLMQPMLPRLYSIASSQKEVGDEVHLTVSLLQYHSNGHLRRGAATYYLCYQTSLYERSVAIYTHPNRGFTLPSDQNAPIIMVGPGTGIAPFRGFLQERAKTAGKNWLFFGEWNRAYNFYYEEFLLDLEKQGKLRLDLAFSRDQADKIYVQHKMLAQGKELFQWLQDGAYLFVCGDADHMAKDVDAALHHIVQQEGHLDEQSARTYVKNLRTTKRYLRDVY